MMHASLGKSAQKRRDSEMKLNRLRKTLHLLHNDQVTRTNEFNSFQGQQINVSLTSI